MPLTFLATMRLPAELWEPLQKRVAEYAAATAGVPGRSLTTTSLLTRIMEEALRSYLEKPDPVLEEWRSRKAKPRNKKAK